MDWTYLKFVPGPSFQSQVQAFQNQLQAFQASQTALIDQYFSQLGSVIQLLNSLQQIG